MRITQSQLIYEAITVILQTFELTKVTPLKNGCYAVGYAGKGTIVSGKKIAQLLETQYNRLYQKAYIRKLVTNSKTVVFIKQYTNSAYTDKGYRVALNSCSCPFAKHESEICKHMIAYARLNGISSLSEYIQQTKVA